MQSTIQICGQDVFLSREMLIQCNIPTELHRKWKERYPSQWIIVGAIEYFNYDYIPDETRAKLPSKNQLAYEAEQEQGQKSVKWWDRLLSEAVESKSIAKYRNEIREMGIPVTDEKINGFARKAAAFECIVSHYTGQKGELTALHQAYKQHFTNGYTMKNRFRMAVTQAKNEGVLSVSIDNRYLSGLKKVFDSRIECWAMAFLSSGKKYNISLAHQLLTEKCQAEQCPVPSISWLRGFAERPEIANSIREQRIGVGLYNDTLPKATIIPAENVGDQWQIDGWRIPFLTGINWLRLLPVSLYSTTTASSGN